MSTSLKALIFDVDGTLAETEELHRSAFNQMFKDYGLDWHWDQKVYGQLLGVAGGRNRLQYFIEEFQPPLAGDFIDYTVEMHAKKTAIYGGLVETGSLILRPGVEALINQAIGANLTLGICTSTSRKNVNALFAATMGLGVLKHFKAVCCGDEVEQVKPDPELYLLALEKLALEPQECLAFEDSHIGLTSSLAADIPTIITYSAYTKGEDFTGALQVMDDLVIGKFELPTTL